MKYLGTSWFQLESLKLFKTLSATNIIGPEKTFQNLKIVYIILVL